MKCAECKTELLKEIRGIVSRALRKRQDSQQIIKSSICGDYIQANVDTVMEIEIEILEHFNNKDTTKNCFLEYVEGYLTCTYNHKIGEECLMNKKEI